MKKSPFNRKSIRRLHHIKQQYEQEGAMTLRRIYYVLVGKGLIASGKQGYKTIKQLCKRGRELGYLDWKVVADRARRIVKRQTFPTFDKMFEAACDGFRRNSMLEQDKYVEVWIEKDAVSGNILEVTYDLDVPLVVGRGFSSITYIHNASRRVLDANQKGLKMLILYISDLDAQGEHIPELVRTKFLEYGCPEDSFQIKKIALTEKQVEEFQLPQNIVFKLSREERDWAYVQRFVERYGEVQYELDALSAVQLNNILLSELEKVMDLTIPEKSDQASRGEVEAWLEEHYQSEERRRYESSRQW